MATYAQFADAAQRHGISAREYQSNLVRMGTAGLPDADIEAITDLAIEARQRGDENTSVKHVASAYFGTACECAMCLAA